MGLEVANKGFNWEINREDLSFDWKESSFEEFLERLREKIGLVKTKNIFGMVAKSKYFVSLGITDTTNWKQNLMSSKCADGDLKLLLLLSLFNDQEQILTDILLGEEINDKQRISIEKMLQNQYYCQYYAENNSMNKNNILETFNERFELVIKKSGKLND